MPTTIRVEVVKRHTRGRFVLRWPGHEQYAVATNEADAYREAFTLEQRLNNPTHEILSWATACDSYENWYLQSLSIDHLKSWKTARRSFERFCGGTPPDLPDITNHKIAEFAAHVGKDCEMETVRNYCRYLRGFFNWAESQEWINRAPKLRLPRRGRGEKRSKGRPLAQEEFERMLRATRAVVGPKHASPWRLLLRGLWESSLRIGEAAKLHWSHGPVQVNLTGEFPMIDFNLGDKGGHRRLPITPSFAKLLRRLPQRGYVFNPKLSRGSTRSRDTWSHKVGEIGAKANIIVDPKTKKRASAHDLRRSFLQRWRGRLDPSVLQLLARHESYETTKQYYLADEADIVAAAVWGGASVDVRILQELRT